MKTVTPPTGPPPEPHDTWRDGGKHEACAMGHQRRSALSYVLCQELGASQRNETNSEASQDVDDNVPGCKESAQRVGSLPLRAVGCVTRAV